MTLTFSSNIVKLVLFRSHFTPQHSKSLQESDNTSETDSLRTNQTINNAFSTLRLQNYGAIVIANKMTEVFLPWSVSLESSWDGLLSQILQNNFHSMLHTKTCDLHHNYYTATHKNGRQTSRWDYQCTTSIAQCI